ncbi:MAG: branched-chain amino acid transport system substrate-binding protein [Actinomycetota bacterium]|nr:branched-chain amino acid transport system substrate-binding protein [Actinomycetota bacterium]
MSSTTRRAALGALVSAILFTSGCGTRVERAAILSAEGQSAAAPAGAGDGFGGTIATTGTAGTDSAAISTDPAAAAGSAGPGAVAAAGTAGSTTGASRTGAAAAGSPASAGKKATAGATSAGAAGAGSSAGSGSTSAAGTTAAASAAATPQAPTVKGCAKAGSPLVIGQVGGFSGIVSNVLLPARIGMQVWVSDINARGGIACHPVKLFQVDDGSDSSRSAAAVRDLVENKKVVALVGSSVPISIVGYRSASEQLKIPSVGGDSLNYDWSQSPVLFPQGATFSATIIGAVKQLADQGKTKLGVIYCVEARNCQDANKVMVDGGDKVAGATVVYRSQISLAQTGFGGQCQSAKDAGAQQVLLAMDGSAISRVMKSCAQIDYFPAIATSPIAIGSSVTQDPNVRKAGVSLAHIAFPWTQADNPAEQRYQQAMARSAPGVASDGATSQAWVAGEMLRTLVDSLGDAGLGDITTELVYRGLANLKGTTLDGLTSPITFGAGQAKAPENNCYFPVLLTEDKGFVAPNGSRPTCL